jgi:predicted DNA-binding transcriptional regulator YafY
LIVRHADRLDLLLRALRDRPGITTRELARELGVTQRTVFRDLEALRERGYPIAADRGRGGGMQLHPNWGLSRVPFSTEEALGALVSFAVSEKLAFPIFAEELKRGRRKLLDAFPGHDRRRLGLLRERIFVGPPASDRVRQSYQPPAPAAMRELQLAFITPCALVGDYVNERDERTQRRVEPHALLISWPAWYVLAFDHRREQSRVFRLDRFENVRCDRAAPFRPRPRDMLAQVSGGERLAPLLRTLE